MNKRLLFVLIAFFAISITGWTQSVPINNTCDSAIVITVLSDSIPFSTIGATTNGPEHPTACLPSSGATPGIIYNDVWFKWTATLTGKIEFSTCNKANFDTKIAVYGPNVECPGSDANILACSEDGPGCANFESVLTFDAEEGKTYLLRIGGWGNGAPGESGFGTFSLKLFEESGTPPNNTCETAIEVNLGEGIEFTTIGATTDGPEHPTACLPAGGSTPGIIYNDVYYKWKANFTGTAEFSTCGTANFDTKIAVYGPNAACPLTDADVIGCSEDAGGCAGFTSKVKFEVMEGQTFILRIGGWGSGAPGESGFGTFSISNITVSEGPVNDNCDNAITVMLSDSIAFSTLGATTDGPRHPTACLPSGGSTPDVIYNDVWYKWTAQETGAVEFSTCNKANFDTKIAVYGPNAVCPGTDANIIACSEDGPGCANFESILVFDAEEGKEYLLRIGGWGSGAPGESGFGSFSLLPFRPTNAPINDNCFGAIELDLGASDSTLVLFSTAGARTGKPEHNPQSCFDVGERFVYNDIWYTWKSTFTGFLEWSNCGTSNFDSRMAVYVASPENECNISVDSLIGCSDDGLDINDNNCGNFTSRAVFPVEEGKVYKFRLGGWSPADLGDGVFTVKRFVPPAPPVNDNCENATPAFIATSESATNFDVVFEGTNRSGSSEGTINPVCRPSGEFLDVWYRFNSGFNKEVEFRFFPVQENTQFVVDLFSACDTRADSSGANYCLSTSSFRGQRAFIDTIVGFTGQPTEWLLRISTRITSDAPGEFFFQLVGQPFTSGVGTLELENFKFFPNPVTQTANISFDLKNASVTRLSVSNAMGQMVIKQHLGTLYAGKQNIELDTSGLANGIYFLNIQTGEGLKTIRFVKSSH